LDGVTGPCNDSNSDGVCDSIIPSWQISQQYLGAGRIAFPMALPINVDFPTNHPFSPLNPYLLNIGPTSGITAEQLHLDTWTVNNQNIFASQSGCGSMTTGGSFQDGNGAGVYNFNFLPCTDDAYSYLIMANLAIKSLTNNNYFIQIIQPIATSTVLDYSFDTDTVTVNLETDSNGDVATTYDTLATCLNNPAGSGCCTSGGASCTQVFNAQLFPQINSSNVDVVYPVSKTQLNYIYNTVSNAAENVGFRCVTPIKYDEYN
jgi:hypothetical protein